MRLTGFSISPKISQKVETPGRWSNVFFRPKCPPHRDFGQMVEIVHHTGILGRWSKLSTAQGFPPNRNLPPRNRFSISDCALFLVFWADGRMCFLAQFLLLIWFLLIFSNQSAPTRLMSSLILPLDIDLSDQIFSVHKMLIESKCAAPPLPKVLTSPGIFPVSRVSSSSPNPSCWLCFCARLK